MRDTIEKWHEIVATNNIAALGEIVHADAVFRSPMAHTPYPSGMALIFALSNVLEVFENFTYHREFINEDERSAVLEFSASIGAKSLKGIDLIRFDADGKIIEFEVMVRPMSGLKALGEQMAPRMQKLMGKA